MMERRGRCIQHISQVTLVSLNPTSISSAIISPIQPCHHRDTGQRFTHQLSARFPTTVAWDSNLRGSHLTHRCTCRLYRDSTLYKDGKHVRDLSKLNRELSKVMLVTSDPDAFYLNPENAIKVLPS